MHSSAKRIGGKFLEHYVSPGMKSVLEIGSLDVNGSLRELAPRNLHWTGVDLESGKGVDVVVEAHQPLPFADDYFDIVVATSIFEHDTAFWKTLSEMSRVLSSSGYIYISAPSNGPIHRFPLDVFRFYPDAGLAFTRIVQESGKPEAFLSESFVANQDEEGIWNDMVAIIAASPSSPKPKMKIFDLEACRNIWSDGLFVVESFCPEPQDRWDVRDGQSHIKRAERLESEIGALKSSWSWRLTRPLRLLGSIQTRDK